MTKIYKKEKYDIALEKLYLKKLEQNDLDGALGLIDTMQSLHGESKQVYLNYATVYYKMGLYDFAINNWFKFYTLVGEKQRARVYNALGACYYKIDDKPIAGYYFNEQIKTKDKTIYEYNNVGAEFFDEIYDNKSDYYIAYPYEIADFTKEINRSADLIKSGEYQRAIDLLSIIPKQSKFYSDALIQCALCYYFLEQKEKSVSCIEEALNTSPTDLIALCNAISLYCDTGDKIRVDELIKKLTSMPESKSVDNLYKVFMVYCEVSEYELAEKTAEEFLKHEPYNTNVLFLYGITEYNLRKFDKAEKAFLKCHRLTKSYISKHYYHLANKQVNAKRKTKSKLKFTFDLPHEGKSDLLAKMGQIIFDMKGNGYTEKDLDNILSYAFDGRVYSVQSSAVSMLFKIGNEYAIQKLKEILINPVCFDKIKTGIIGYFVSLGLSGDFPIVYYSIIRNLTLYKANIYDETNTIFNEAYAYTCGKVSPMNFDMLSLKESIEKLFNISKEYNLLSEITDVKALSAVIFEYADKPKHLNRKQIAKTFDANIRMYKKIRDLFLPYITE